MSEPPELLWGPGLDGDPSPTAIPRQVALDIRRKSPALALSMGITDEALADGRLRPPVLGKRPIASNARGIKPTLGPADALGLHAELRAAFVRREMHRWLGAWLTGMDRESVLGRGIDAQAEAAGRIWAEVHREALHECPTFLVAGEANPLLTAAAESLPWSVVPERQMPPSEEGFLAFAVPYAIEDYAGNNMLIRAITWSTAHTDLLPASQEGWPPEAEYGFMVTFWTSYDDDPPADAATVADRRKVRDLLGTRLMIAQSMPLPIGVPIESWPLFNRILDDEDNSGVVGPLSLLLATWMLMRQPITSITRGSMPPRVRKEIRKRGRIRGDVSVINLRRRAPSDHPPADGEPVRREYHYRWTVKGHWRLQPCGPGRAEREWIYIFAHVKGPADAPLKQRARVYRVSGRP
jgi:hypothetical protein